MAEIHTSDHSIICPHAICDSCGKNSGPTYTLPHFQDCIDRLRSNSIPFGVEPAIMLQHIREAEVKITQLDAELNRLQNEVDSLQQQRDILQKFKDRRKSLLAPIRKLPEDVLREVFVSCQMLSEPEGMIHSYDQTAFVRAVTKVCKYWRAIARSTPELWPRITAHGLFGRSSKGDKVGLFLEDCLSLSGRLPLHIRLEEPYTSTSLGDSCIQSLARCAARWKELHVNDTELFGDILKCIDPDAVLASLEQLSLHSVISSISINPTPLLSCFQAGPSVCSYTAEAITVSFRSAPCLLRNFTVTDVPHPMSVFVDFPWSQITTFKISSNEFEENELASLLMAMPNLVSFTLGGHPNITSDPLTLLSLKTLTVRDEYLPDEPDDDKPVLDVFTAPHIDILHLHVEVYSSSLFEFLTRSCCPLVDLELTETALNGNWMAKCPSLHSVRSLCLNSPTKTFLNDILVLTRQDSEHSGHRSHMIFPQLQSLDIQWATLPADREYSDVIQPLIRMLESRIAPVEQHTGMIEFEEDITIRYLERVNILFYTKYFRLTEEEEIGLLELNRSDLVRQSGVKLTIAHGHSNLYHDILRDGVEFDDSIQVYD